VIVSFDNTVENTKQTTQKYITEILKRGSYKAKYLGNKQATKEKKESGTGQAGPLLKHKFYRASTQYSQHAHNVVTYYARQNLSHSVTICDLHQNENVTLPKSLVKLTFVGERLLPKKELREVFQTA
jgi:hypothetical protein